MILRKILSGASLLIVLSACAVGSTPTRTPLPSPVSVTVRQLILDEKGFVGQKVAMSGTVVLGCTSGCWFFLNDGTGTIYIEMATAGLQIPQKVGKRVTLRGDIVGSGGNLHVSAESVEFPE